MGVLRPERQVGFSLMELLIVLVIISTLYAVTAVSINAFFADKLDETAKNLKHTLQSLQLDSTISSGFYGINFNKQGYQTIDFAQPQVTKKPKSELTDTNIFEKDEAEEEASQAKQPKRVLIDPDIRFEVRIDDLPLELEDPEGETELEAYLAEGKAIPPPKAHVMVFPSGEMTAFEIVLMDLVERRTISMKWDAVGNLEVSDE